MKKKVVFGILVTFLFSFNCYAEGQDGIAAIYNFVHFIWVFIDITIYIIFGTLLIKLIFQKIKFPLKNITLKAFYISFFITFLAYLLLGDAIWYNFKN